MRCKPSAFAIDESTTGTAAAITEAIGRSNKCRSSMASSMLDVFCSSGLFFWGP